MLQARLEQSTHSGAYKLDVRIFDLRDVDLALAQIVDEKPVLVITFNTQQVTVTRDAKTGQVAEGKEVRPRARPRTAPSVGGPKRTMTRPCGAVGAAQDDVENVYYVMAMVRDKATPRDPVTYGWRVMEMGVQGAIKTW